MAIYLKYEPFQQMLRAADRGFEVPYKAEAIGYLLGRRRRQGGFLVVRAIPFRGGERARTWVDPGPGFDPRGRVLAKHHRLSWIGCFHSHLESGGQLLRGLSPEDLRTYLEMNDEIPSLEVELIVSLSRPRNPRLAPKGPTNAFFAYNREKAYRYLIKGYVRAREGLRCRPVRPLAFPKIEP